MGDYDDWGKYNERLTEARRRVNDAFDALMRGHDKKFVGHPDYDFMAGQIADSFERAVPALLEAMRDLGKVYDEEYEKEKGLPRRASLAKDSGAAYDFVDGLWDEWLGDWDGERLTGPGGADWEYAWKKYPRFNDGGAHTEKAAAYLADKFVAFALTKGPLPLDEDEIRDEAYGAAYDGLT